MFPAGLGACTKRVKSCQKQGHLTRAVNDQRHFWPATCAGTNAPTETGHGPWGECRGFMQFLQTFAGVAQSQVPIGCKINNIMRLRLFDLRAESCATMSARGGGKLSCLQALAWCAPSRPSSHVAWPATQPNNAPKQPLKSLGISTTSLGAKLSRKIRL